MLKPLLPNWTCAPVSTWHFSVPSGLTVIHTARFWSQSTFTHAVLFNKLWREQGRDYCPLHKRQLGLREVISQGHQPIYVRAGTLAWLATSRPPAFLTTAQSLCNNTSPSLWHRNIKWINNFGSQDLILFIFSLKTFFFFFFFFFFPLLLHFVFFLFLF